MKFSLVQTSLLLTAVSAFSLFSFELPASENLIAAKKKCEPFENTPNQPSQKESLVLLPSQACPENWRVSGEFLYLLPTLDDTYFVLDAGISTTYPSGKRKNNDFGFNPAFRVGAEYAFCNTHRELQAFYSHLSAAQTRTVTGANLWSTIGRPDLCSSFEDYEGSASSTLNLLYQNLELSFSQQILNSYGFYCYIQPGLEYSYLRLNENYTFSSTTGLGIIQEKSKAWGVGPQIGIGFDYSFYQGPFTRCTTQAFSISSLFSGSILMGQGTNKNEQTLTGAPQLDIKDEHTWKTIPALHARVGLNYLIHASKFGVALGIGYEFNTYVRALTRVIFPDDVADGLCSTNYYNFDLQGLSVAAALSF